MNFLQARLAKTWLRFQDVIGQRVTTIEKGTAAATKGELTDDLLETAAGEAHKLAGSLGTFGLMNGSDVARRLEELFNAGLPVESVEDATRLAQRLRSIITAGPPVAAETPSPDRPSLLVLMENRDIQERVAGGAATLGVEGIIAVDPAAALEWMGSRRPSMAVVDMDFEDAGDNGPSRVLETLAHRFPESPALGISTDVTIEDRISLGSAGNCGFLQKPAQASEILDAIGSLIAPRAED